MDKDQATKGGFAAQFSPSKNALLLNPEEEAWKLFILSMHETVHAKTNQRLSVSPSSPENALATTISREQGDIADFENYQSFMGVDEMKAYFRDSHIFHQLERHFNDTNQSELAAEMVRIGKDRRGSSEKAADVTRTVLTAATKHLTEMKLNKKYNDLKVSWKDESQRAIVVVNLSLPYPDGSPLDIKYYIFNSSDHLPTPEEALPKAIEFSEKLVKVARVYKQRLRELSEKPQAK